MHIMHYTLSSNYFQIRHPDFYFWQYIHEVTKLVDHIWKDLFYISEIASEHQEVSASVIKKAYLATEEEFLSVVREQWRSKPQIASVGTCCLVGIICNGLLYVANAGDSRVVLGRAERAVRGVTAVQLSTEHNASMESVRDELRSLHPDDSQIVVLKHKIWRVKGIIQVIFFTSLH